MDIYKTIRHLTSVRSPRLRLAMLLAAHLTGRRLIGVYLDPVLACNLRCRMCGFSDPDHRESMHGRMTDSQIEAAARGLFGRALKVQIGCGAEPTLDRRVADIIRRARQAGVPYISVTTNGQLLTEPLLRDYAEAGLSELTLSLHGTRVATYEWLMDGAHFDRFLATLDAIRAVKRSYPSLKLRVNFTVNADNFEQIPELLDLFGPGLVDIIQLRPVQRLGSTAYSNFDLTEIKAAYSRVFTPFARRCQQQGVTCLMPTEAEIDAVAAPRSARERMFEDVTYCYVGPGSCYRPDYDAEQDDYRSYHHRNHTARRLMQQIFSLRRDRSDANDTTKKLNYGVNQ